MGVLFGAAFGASLSVTRGSDIPADRYACGKENAE